MAIAPVIFIPMLTDNNLPGARFMVNISGNSIFKLKNREK